jgi:hypothetical protein
MRTLRTLQLNWIRWLLGLCFVFETYWYFGWHRWPKSDAEIICDGIGFVILALAVERKVPNAN